MRGHDFVKKARLVTHSIVQESTGPALFDDLHLKSQAAWAPGGSYDGVALLYPLARVLYYLEPSHRQPGISVYPWASVI